MENRNYDGFSARFIIFFPSGVYLELKDQIALKEKEYYFTKIIAVIRIVHSKFKQYSFTEEAFQYLNKIKREHDEVIQKYENKQKLCMIR